MWLMTTLKDSLSELLSVRYAMQFCVTSACNDLIFIVKLIITIMW